jgi:hypothetical protein
MQKTMGFLLFLLFSLSCAAQPIDLAYRDKIVKAIYIAEGGAKTKYPFGIKSINTNGDYNKAKRICENTVSNNWDRWVKAGKTNNYIDFLADRYCPPSCDKQGNLNWKKNIRALTK